MTTTEMRPNMGFQWNGNKATVIASVITNDAVEPWTWTMLVLHPAAPHFQVVEWDGSEGTVESDRFMNIVPAVAEYEQ